ncbi:hypothetical protein DSO57_1007639 [Entomophthora muscae]|uniref:Uncharacterized protein n=1 Tax=Entomophthora muscae TaxID=34485 RepID=A0ACC2SKC7_9FUNG|nr:hypothetical protein DSO57_1007639 [Entomophthora muscae]
MVFQPVITNLPTVHRWTEPVKKPVNYDAITLTSLTQVNANQLGQFVDSCVGRLFDQLSPTASHLEYYQTILKCSNATYQIVITSLVYLTRLAAKRSPVLVTHPAHVIYTVLLMLSFAFIEDSPYHTKSWAEVSHISIQLLNSVVREVLASFNYRLMVAQQQYLKWESSALEFFQCLPVTTFPSMGQDPLSSLILYDFFTM